jgi:hypothetical protein
MSSAGGLAAAKAILARRKPRADHRHALPPSTPASSPAAPAAVAAPAHLSSGFSAPLSASAAVLLGGGYHALVTPASSDTVLTLLFGAFDRHNFGDLLFPHIAAALLAPEYPVFAGLVAQDLRPFGGHRVEALADLAIHLRHSPVNILHTGGELLACDAWQAAAMTLPPEEAQHIIARLDRRPREALEWARQRIGLNALAPYTVQRDLFPQARTVLYNAVGGIDIDTREEAFREEVLCNLRAADGVGVRDASTRGHLQAAGISARFMPDPAVMVAELFGDDIRRRSGEGEIARIRHAFPNGYLAVQFSADFGDDGTLPLLADRLAEVANTTKLGIVFFRAGSAPWHDDIDCFKQVAACMPSGVADVFTSLDVWDICAMIAASRGYLGSSLHGRIVAMAFALPRMNLVRFPGRSKQAAFAATWDAGSARHTVEVDGIVQGMQEALTADTHLLQRQARQLADCYRQAFRSLCSHHINAGMHKQ